MVDVFWLVGIPMVIPLASAYEGNNTLNFSKIFDHSKRSGSKQPNEGIASQVLPLAQYVTETYLAHCSLLLVLHASFKFEGDFDESDLLRYFPFPVAHTRVTKNGQVRKELLEMPGSHCRGFMLFLKDISITVKMVGNHTFSKVVVITSSSRWKIEEFLRSSDAKGIVNLLVIATAGASDIIIRPGEKSRDQKFINLYTHDLFVDGVGGSQVKLITSWRGNTLARNINLFPTKLSQGFNGRQFAVTASQQPPFVVKKADILADDADHTLLWDGIEVRLLRLLSHFLNYTMEIKESKPLTILKGPAEAAAEAVEGGLAEIAIAGVFRTTGLPNGISFSTAHSVDCAAFVTRSSTALPRYRAILGPFHWHVWLALTLTYFLAILPLTFAEKHSLMYLWNNPWHLETMFWYVFGTFTNLFTFKGDNTWTRSKKNASRMLIGWYWIFSIIVTACYTGSIIAFITLFVYPPVIDTVDQLLADNFRVGSLSTGGWGSWFNNSDHPKTKWLLRDIELIPNVTQGLKNVTGSYYLPLLRPYAFLSSAAHLDYVINNFTLKSRKDVLHVSRDCFVPFGVTLMYPKNAPYRIKFDEFILRAQQGGLVAKIFNDMQWDLQRSATGQRMQVKTGESIRKALVQDRRLTLDDTQGMFLLLGAGFLIATVAMFSELSGHHKAIGHYCTIFRWRSNIFYRHFIARIQNECFAANLKTESPVATHEFIFKKYDSRILNSQYQNVEPTRFFSENVLLSKDRCKIRTGSLPALQLHAKVLWPSTSCHQLSARPTCTQCYSINESATDLKRIIRFGSVGSMILPKHFKEVLKHDFFYDRPQTSEI